MTKRVFFLIILFIFCSEVRAQRYQWVRQFGGSGYDAASDIALDQEGNIIAVGTFEGTVDFDPGSKVVSLTAAGESDVFVSKFSAGGDLIWVKAMGGASDDGVGAVAVDAAGNVYTTGAYKGGADFNPGAPVFTLGGYAGIFISKLDASGNFVWAKGMSDGEFDSGMAIAVDAAGNVYASGHFEGGGDFDPGPNEFSLYTPGGYGAYIVKLNSDGGFGWAKCLQGDALAQGQYITVDTDRNVYVAGSFKYTPDFDPGEGVYTLTSSGNFDGGFDGFILKLDASGNFVWAKQMGGPGNDNVDHITIDNSGNFYMVGYFSGRSDLDPGEGVFEMTTQGYSDAFIAKLDPSGNFVWARSFGGSDNDFATSVCVDGLGGVFLSGTFASVIDLDPGPAALNFTTLSDQNAFVVKLTPSGDFLWGTPIGKTGWVQLEADASGTLFGLGTYAGTMSLVGDAFSLTGMGASDVFAFKIDALVTDVAGEPLREQVAVYPNPLQDVVNIKVPEHRLNQYKIVDQYGRQIRAGALSDEVTVVNTTDLAPGCYFIFVGDQWSKVVKF